MQQQFQLQQLYNNNYSNPQLAAAAIQQQYQYLQQQLPQQARQAKQQQEMNGQNQILYLLNAQNAAAQKATGATDPAKAPALQQ